MPRKFNWQSGETVWGSYNPWDLQAQPAYKFLHKPKKAYVSGAMFGKTKHVANIFDAPSLEKKNMNTPKTTPRRRSSSTKSVRRLLLKELKNVSSKKQTPAKTVAATKKRAAKALDRTPRMQQTSSKSGGFFARPTVRYTKFDNMNRLGMTVCREYGATLNGSVLNPVQSVMIMHSTAGWKQLVRDISYAMAKMVALKLKVDVEDFSNLITTATSAETFRVRYRNNPVSAITSFDVGISPVTTIKNLGDSIFAALISVVFANPWLKLISAEYLYGTPLYRKFKVDLKQATFEYYAKSTLKLQNQTINTEGNDEQDDVDNAPLHGKSYEGSGSYFSHNEDFYYPNEDEVQANTNIFGFLGVHPLAEPQPLTVMKRCQRQGKAHLDPGQIKTSVLSSRFKHNLTYILNRISATAGTSNAIPFGDFRVFHLEKMIQAVGTTNVNAIRVSFESDLKTGGILRCPSEPNTTMPLVQFII